MTPPSDKFTDKLRDIAEEIAEEKPELHFLGLVHRTEGPPGDWDLLVSSDQIEPWSIDSIKYVVAHLRRRLSAAEMTRIATVVALPADNALLTHLSQGGEAYGLHPMDQIDRAVVIWPSKHASPPARTG
ncbi:MAG TPA: hypothetical protein VK797_26610 [Tepidisphaeraceae bacterium]|jgi:hypothetical protein|nr:hypothetical protein [Tepidisphaeraceae bacterium]